MWLWTAGLLLWIVAEVAVIVWLAHNISWWTLLLMAATSMLGVWMVLHEGARSLQRLRDAIHSGIAAPDRAGSTGLTLLGGALLVLPGFLSDAVGLLLAVPVTQAPLRRLLGRRLGRSGSGSGSMRAEPVVIAGEVVEEEDVSDDDGPLVIEGTVVDDEEEPG